MPRILYPEFREQLAPTSYPFIDGATLRSDTGLVLENELILDASLYPIGARRPVRLSSLDVDAALVRLAISDDLAERASATFNPAECPGTLPLVDGNDRPAGVLVMDPDVAARFGAWPLGLHKFTAAATTFAGSCVIPTPEIGVRGILGPQGQILADEVLLVGDRGVVLESPRDNEIIFNVVGDPLFSRRQCEAADLWRPPRFVRTINGCPPDENGEFQIIVGDHLTETPAVRIYFDGDALVIAMVGTGDAG